MSRWSRLLVSQRDEILEHLVSAELDPADFHWRTWSDPTQGGYGQECDRPVHRPTEFSIMFEWFRETEQFGGFCTPGPNGPSGKFYASPWPKVSAEAKAWAERLRREVSTPNHWQAARAGLALLQRGDERDDDEFSTAEAATIGDRLDAIEARLLQSESLTSEQRQVIRRGLVTFVTRLRRSSGERGLPSRSGLP